MYGSSVPDSSLLIATDCKSTPVLNTRIDIAFTCGFHGQAHQVLVPCFRQHIVDMIIDRTGGDV